MKTKRPSRNPNTLPPLPDEPTTEIVVENIHAQQILYFAAMLEESRLFQVVDRLVALFSQGLLPVGRSHAGKILYNYWKASPDRLTDVERRRVYARAFGFPSGDADGTPNREFNDLWLRFLAAVSTYAGQLSTDTTLRPKAETVARQEPVRRSGRDLASNLSLHGYGLAYFAAKQLQGQIQEITHLLSDSVIKNAYGARDMWQVIERVVTLELGGSQNLVRYRTQAESGSIIIRWLANRRSLLLRPRPSIVLKDDDIRKHRTAAKNKTSTYPTDCDLVNACKQWLTATTTTDT